jgi:fumarate reductase subunit D
VGIAAAFLAFQIPGYFDPDIYARLPMPESMEGLVFMGLVLCMVGSQVYRYRKVSTTRQKRQTKLVVGGAATAICVLFAILVPLFVLPPTLSDVSPFALAFIGAAVPFTMLLIPLSIGVAVLRSGLFDIDVLINRALVYGMLTVSLALVYFGGVAGFQRFLSPLVGEENQLAVVASTLAIAALFQPFRRRIQNFIDRRFYREKYDAARTLEAFAARLRDETELENLSGDLIGVVGETVRPAHVSLWLKPSGESGRYEGGRS